jgi:hypothetical protein
MTFQASEQVYRGLIALFYEYYFFIIYNPDCSI